VQLNAVRCARRPDDDDADFRTDYGASEMSGTVTGVHRFVGRDGLRSTEFVPVLGDDQRRVVIVARHEQPLAGDLVLGASLRRRGGVG